MLSPKGIEVLLRVCRLGVCHYDLHIAGGLLDLGEEGVLNMADLGLKLPLAMGHEFLSGLVAAGPQVEGAPVGKTMLVFPKI